MVCLVAAGFFGLRCVADTHVGGVAIVVIVITSICIYLYIYNTTAFSCCCCYCSVLFSIYFALVLSFICFKIIFIYIILLSAVGRCTLALLHLSQSCALVCACAILFASTWFSAKTGWVHGFVLSCIFTMLLFKKNSKLSIYN